MGFDTNRISDRDECGVSDGASAATPAGISDTTSTPSAATTPVWTNNG